MNLTKRQKKYIKNNYPRNSIQEISKSLNVKIDVIVNYLRLTGLYQVPTKKRYSKKWFRTNNFYFSIVLLVLSIVIGIYCFDKKLYISGDNVEFIELGKSIAGGKGLSGNPKYPFGFPLLLALTQMLFNQSLLAQKVLVLLMYISSSVLVFLIFKRFIGERWAFLVTFLSVTNPFVIEFSHYVMSEIPFLFFSFLGIYLFEIFKDKSLKSWQIYIAILAVAGVYYVRSIGIALIGAAICYYFLKKEWKKGLIISGLFFILWIPWYIRGKTVSAGGSYFNQFLYRDPYRPELGYIDFTAFIERLVLNLKTYFFVEIPYGIIPYHFRTSMVNGGILPLFLGIILAGIFMAGLIWAFLNRQYLLSVYGIFYLAVVMVWPEVWRGARFIIPIIPIFVFFTAYFLYKLYKISYNKVNKNLIYGLLVSVALLLLLITFKNIYSYRGLMKNYPPEWANYFKAAEWARDNTPKDCIIADRKAGLFGTVSLRRCTGFPSTTDRKVIIKYFYDSNVDFVVVPNPRIGYSYSIITCLVPAINEYRDRFSQVFFIDNPPTYIFQFDRTGKILE